MSNQSKQGAIARRSQAGFTLVELSVVIVIIGVLAAFGVPRFRAAVERSKAGEAFNYLTSIRSAQENYNNREGTYTTDLNALDIKMTVPKYFDLGTMGADENGWNLILTRKAGSSGYGAYIVGFDQDGYNNNSSMSNISSEINPMSI